MKSLMKFLTVGVAGLIFSAAAFADYTVRCTPPAGGSEGRCQFTRINEPGNNHSFNCKVSFNGTAHPKVQLVLEKDHFMTLIEKDGEWINDTHTIQVTPDNVEQVNNKVYHIGSLDPEKEGGNVYYTFKVLGANGEVLPASDAGRDTHVECTVTSTH